MAEVDRYGAVESVVVRSSDRELAEVDRFDLAAAPICAVDGFDDWLSSDGETLVANCAEGIAVRPLR